MTPANWYNVEGNVVINGKKYSRVMAHEDRAKALEHAAGLRRLHEGMRARVIREGGKYTRYPWKVVIRQGR